MTFHAEYRDWCPDCVHGREASHEHRRANGETLGSEVISDYAFMTSEKTMSGCNIRRSLFICSNQEVARSRGLRSVLRGCDDHHVLS